MNHHYNKNLKEFARENRKRATKAEIKIWSQLLKSKQTGYSFLRQRPILNYIADFFCKELKLIIEIDGVTHNEKLVDDQLKDKKLNLAGYHVLRFTDEQVMNNLEGVEKVFLGWVENR